jgi:CheY-like chemotaxis protein
MDRDDRITSEQLQTVLLHLHDLGFLASHPVVDDLVRWVARPTVRSGMHLRTLLLDLIESLRPTRPYDVVAPEWRHYVILSDRYVKQRPLWEIQQKLALGERQMRREHQRALAALSMLAQQEAPPPDSETSAAPLAAAVQRLALVPSHFALLELVEDVAHLVARTRGSLQEKNAQENDVPPLQVDIDPPTLKTFTDRGILHQLLLTLAQFCAGSPGGAASMLSATRENGQVRIDFVSPCELQPLADPERAQLCDLLARALSCRLEWHPHSVSLLLPSSPRTRTVLIVDDEPAALELFRSYLAGLNYEVITESKAENVLSCVVASGPDLVMLDIMMPAMDGWEVLQRLRHMPTMRDVPIIACSVLNDANLAYALGATHFLKKPVLRNQLVHLIHELLDAERSG